MKAGEPILTIGDPQLESELAAAQAELESADVDLRNIHRGPTVEEMNEVEADVARYRLELDNAQKTLEKDPEDHRQTQPGTSYPKTGQ